MDKNNMIQELKKSFVYNASLGSKELFHSNTWAWLLERDKKFVKVFFDIDIEKVEIKNILRESKNIDLTVETKKHGLYIIENKLKSIPSKEQLEKYTKDNNGVTKGLLTGVIQTLDLSELEKWSFTDYKTIAKKIREVLPSSELNTNENKYVEEYCGVIEKISCLLNDDNKEDILKFSDALNEIRLGDISHKFLMARLKKEVNIENLPCEKELMDLVHWTGYNRKSASMGFQYNPINHKFRYYIEIQGYQYRYMLMMKENNFDADNLFKMGVENRWFDETYNKLNNKLVFNNETKMSKDYNQYNTNEYTVVYQHYNIEGFTFIDIVNRIEEDMKKAFDITMKEINKEGN